MNSDDPRLTAFALNDPALLDDATRAEIANDPALAAEIADLRRLAAGLRAELHAEEGAPLSPEQRAEVLDAGRAGSPSQPVRSQSERYNSEPQTVAGPRAWWRRPVWATSAAACLIAGLSLAIYYQAEHVRRLRPMAETKPSVSAINLGTDMDFAVVTDPQPTAPTLALPLPATAPLGATPSFGDQLTASASVAPAEMPSAVEFNGFINYGSPIQTTTVDANGNQTVTVVTQGQAMMKGLGQGGTGMLGRGISTGTASTLAGEPARLYARADGTATVKKPSSAALAAGRSMDGYMRGGAGVTFSEPTQGLHTERAKVVRERLGQIERDMSVLASKMPSLAKPEEVRAQLEAKEAELTGSLALAKAAKDGKDKAVELQNELAALGEARKLTDQLITSYAQDEATARERLEEVTKLTAELRSLEQTEPSNTEAYDAITDNPFLTVTQNPLSTFSVDVDTASYANVRRMLNSNQRPPKGAVRIEELVNYFRYEYPQPAGKDPFAATMEVATCPWQPEHRLVRVGLKGREILRSQRPPSNLVFLVDVSGSMEPENKLPLVQECLRLLTDQLGPDDSVSIAVYAGASGCVLEPTHDKDKVRTALARLKSGGSTNGAAGIQLAYDLAQRAFKKGGTNRVILCTDGDFNVGVSSQDQLVSMIEGKAKTGVFLSVLGFGMGNLKDSTLEKLADKGNGNYGYIDSLTEGRRVFVEQMTGTLCTIAKDVKFQVEFNPAQVGAYRLIGYENRLLAKEDFNDDKKDAGEIGAGHTVTALYEIVPAGKAIAAPAVVDELKYTKPAASNQQPAASSELLTVKVRYKQPDADVSTKLEFPLTDSGTKWEQSSRDFRWAAAVAGFGMILRESPHKGSLSWGLVEELAMEGRAEKRDAERAEFVALIDKARALSR